MDKTQKQTKKGWGLVAVAGMAAAVTMGDSLIIAAIGVTLLYLGAKLGGYMEPWPTKSTNQTTTAEATAERRAA